MTHTAAGERAADDRRGSGQFEAARCSPARPTDCHRARDIRAAGDLCRSRPTSRHLLQYQPVHGRSMERLERPEPGGAGSVVNGRLEPSARLRALQPLARAGLHDRWGGDHPGTHGGDRRRRAHRRPPRCGASPAAGYRACVAGRDCPRHLSLGPLLRAARLPRAAHCAGVDGCGAARARNPCPSSRTRRSGRWRRHRLGHRHQTPRRP